MPENYRDQEESSSIDFVQPRRQQTIKLNADVTSQARCYCFWVIYFVLVVTSFGLTRAIPDPVKSNIQNTQFTNPNSSLIVNQNNMILDVKF